MNQACIPIIGLTINFIGAILLAFAFSAGDPVGTQEDNNKKPRPFVLPNFNKLLLRSGVGLLALGFLIQLLALIFFNNT